MPKDASLDEIEAEVLNALREIARDGDKKPRFSRKNLQLAAPKDGDCVYVQIARRLGWPIDELDFDSDSDLLTVLAGYKALQICMKRLQKKGLISAHRRGATDRRSFWVAMD